MASGDLKPEKLSGPQKAAIFLLTMGEEYTMKFFKGLDEASIKKLGKYMSEINYISADVSKKVVDEFLQNFDSSTNLVLSGEDFLKAVVNKTLDQDAAREVFQVIGSNSKTVPFSDLAYISSENLMSIIQGEHPQTIALILSYLPNEKAAEVIALFSE